jgi:hypothetical protein
MATTTKTPKDNTARFALAKLEELKRCVLEQKDLSRRLEELRPRIDDLQGQVGRAVYVLQNLTEAGYLQAKEWEVVNFAWEQYRAALEGRAPREPRTLVDVVKEITSVMEGEFRADAVFDQVQKYLPRLKSKPHRASITSALNHLVIKGELKKTSEGGRGKAAKYERRSVIEALLKELQEDPSAEKD